MSHIFEVHGRVSKAANQLIALRMTGATLRADHPWRHEFLSLEALREEIVTAAHMLVEIDRSIVLNKLSADELGRQGRTLDQLKAQGTVAELVAWTRMSLTWKVFLYSVRCFQDSAYKAILLAQGCPAGQGSSMKTCLKSNEWQQNSLVGGLILKAIPAYPAWFVEMRATSSREDSLCNLY